MKAMIEGGWCRARPWRGRALHLLLLLPLLPLGCDVERPALELELERGRCGGCELTRVDLYLGQPTGQGVCVLRQAQIDLGRAGTLRLDDVGFDVAEWHVRALGYCAEDHAGACARCVGEGRAELALGTLRVELRDAAGCVTPPGPTCTPHRVWLTAADAELAGAMVRDPAAGALASAAIVADLTSDNRGALLIADLPPTDDCYIRAGSHADKAHGNEPRLVIVDNGADDDYTREGLLRFDLQGRAMPVPSMVDGATLRLYGRHGGEGPGAITLRVHATSDDWREQDLTFNSAPPPGLVVGEGLVPSLAMSDLEIGGYVRDELAGDGVASVRVRATSANYIQIPSKEDQQFDAPPRLRLRHWPVVTNEQLDERSATARLTVEVPHDGLWNLWARIYSPEADPPAPDSFWVRIDAGPARVLGDDGERGRWHWVGYGGRGIPLGYLGRGLHSLTVMPREAARTDALLSPRLDLLLLSDDPTYVPADGDAPRR